MIATSNVRAGSPPATNTLGVLLRASRRVPSTLLLIGTLTAWGVASLIEFNASIFVAAIAMCAIGLLVVRLLDRRGGAGVMLFSVAYVLRSIAALMAFFSGKGEAYWVGGVGSDAINYYNSSFLDLGEALFSFSYKGFVTYNSYVTRWALMFDDAHYLCNLQGPVVAGALLVVLVYAAVREMRDERTGYVVALIMALHPAVISISGILLRDSLVGVFGWASLLLLIRLFRARSLPAALLYLALATGTVVILSYLRLQSMLVFLGLALVALYFTTRPSESHPGLPPALRRVAVIGAAVLAAGGAALMLGGKMPAGLDAKYFQSVVEFRLESSAQGSLGVALTSGNLVVGTVIYSVLAFLTPFPFYAWSAEVLGHPTGPLDYLVGMGGVVNQLIAACALVGLARAVRVRDAMSLAWVVSIASFVVITTLGGGDTVRYVAVHVFPFYLLLVVDGARRLRLRPLVLLPWLGVLVSLYTVYETLKTVTGQNFTMLASFVMLLYLAVFLYQAWSLAAPARAARPGSRPQAPHGSLALAIRA